MATKRLDIDGLLELTPEQAKTRLRELKRSELVTLALEADSEMWQDYDRQDLLEMLYEVEAGKSVPRARQTVAELRKSLVEMVS